MNSWSTKTPGFCMDLWFIVDAFCAPPFLYDKILCCPAGLLENISMPKLPRHLTPCAHRNKGSEFLPPATDAKHAPARANGSRKTSRSELVYVGNPLTKRYINGSFLKWWVSPTNPWGFPTKK